MQLGLAEQERCGIWAGILEGWNQAVKQQTQRTGTGPILNEWHDCVLRAIISSASRQIRTGNELHSTLQFAAAVHKH